MNQQIRLKLNDVDVTSMIIGETTLHQAINEPSTLDTTINLVSARLDTLDLRGQIILEVIQDGEVYRQFTGYVVEGLSDGTLYTLHCEDPMQILKEAQGGGAFGAGLLPGEVIFYLLSTVMPESTNGNYIHSGQEGRTIAECDWLFNKRKFAFIAPYPPCKLSQNSVNFGDVTLYTPKGQGNIDDQLIADSLSENHSEEWEEGKGRVLFYVQAESFLEAFEIGRRKLRAFMDFLCFGAHYSTPVYPSQTGNVPHDYNRERSLIDFSYPRWAYVRDLVPSQKPRFWLRWYAPHRRADQLNITADDPLVRLYPLFSELLEEDEKYLSEQQRPLINALHALRNSRQAESTLDGVDFIWQCVEFLSASYSVPELFSGSDRKALRRVTKCLMDKRYKDVEQKDKERRQQLLSTKIGELNRANTREKWEAFCADHNLEYSEADTTFLWKTRDIRNDAIHGRSASIARPEIERAAVLLEKAVIAAVQKLTSTKNE